MAESSSQSRSRKQAASQWTVGIEEALSPSRNRKPANLQPLFGQLETCLDATSFWLIFSFPKGGKVAIRTCFDPQTLKKCQPGNQSNTFAEYQIDGAIGQFTVRVEWPDPERPVLHYTTALRPHQDLTLSALPRDVYVLDRRYRLSKTAGKIFTTQNGPTSGTAYFCLEDYQTGTVLYFQNLTSLNPYCSLTQTDPSGTVGAQWPEIGLSLPTSDKPLPGKKEVILSDAYLYLSETLPVDEFEAADQYIDATAAIYRYIPRPETDYYDWPTTAVRTLQTLTRSSVCSRRIKNHVYLNAYVGSSYKPPESMVQLAILLPLMEYEPWKGDPIKLVKQLQHSVYTFFNEQLGTIVRWLPGAEFKKADADLSEEEGPQRMDSWYLLYSLMNLGRLAGKGDEEAKKMFFSSLNYVIKAAHHFDYEWPVFYNITSLKVYKADPKPGTAGEVDVPGLYTHVMLQAYELTNDKTYLNEAEMSAHRLCGKGFDLLYQTNNTIMSAVTMAKLWRITSNRLYFDLSKVCMASVVAKMWLWDCSFGHAQHYTTFMGVSCLQDASYVASYEEEEAFTAALAYLKLVEHEVSPSLNLLLAEYMKYLLHRGRYYLPAELPEDTICEKPREGHIQRNLPIPLEDLRTGWQQAGQVGQEVYGSASAFVFTKCAYLKLPKVPIVVFTEYPILRADFRTRTPKTGEVTFEICGLPELKCRLRIFPNRKALPSVRVVEVQTGTEREWPLETKTEDFYEVQVPGGVRLRIEWQTESKS
ncbi:hypothetical protein HNV11_02320 [Spirosoma taeanense]|uniref:Uncharacterized protein n=1 Tax=Spirosoma taeanense TaxID=2735870 RepID=A0A6M5Y6I4_9BACT|nr:hypothetical protein [Spirosoma taeanense]QJW88292.1 hypothetical protein HNV11_02320 [Spirosoma taeanense]